VAVGDQHRHHHRYIPDSFSDSELPKSGQRGEVKLNELIRVSLVHNSFVGIEHLTDEEISEIRNKCELRACAEAGSAAVERTGKKAKLAAEHVSS
jgi:low affinity Fe/Cu permease